MPVHEDHHINEQLGIIEDDIVCATRPEDYIKAINDTCQLLGWNDQDRSEAEWAALAHSEISEAFEAYRNNEPLFWKDEIGKPQGTATEYVDAVIRILHWFARHPEVNFESVLKAKMLYNTTRSYRHGNKKA